LNLRFKWFFLLGGSGIKRDGLSHVKECGGGKRWTNQQWINKD
jgi:hypothetical protein